MHVAELQCPLQRNGEGSPSLAFSSLVICVQCCGGVGFEWIGGYATCERGIGVDKELDQVVELVGEFVDGASLGFGVRVREREGRLCLVARREGNVLQVAMGVGYMFAGCKAAIEAGDGEEVALLVAFSRGCEGGLVSNECR